MPTLRELSSELMGHIPRLSYLLARKLVNNAWKDVRDARLWSFSVAEDAFLAPEVEIVGAVAVTFGSNLITADAAAKAEWDAFGLTVPITDRQFRVNTNGPIYNITAYDSSTGVATLDRIYLETTQATANYQIYRAYYKPPEDFLRFESVWNPIDGYPLRLGWTNTEISIRDPIRGAQGLAYYIASYKVDLTTGRPIYEFWPHPTSQRTYQFIYLRKGVDLTDDQPIPVTLNPEVLRQRSLYHGYQWAMANRGRFQELQGVDWRFLRSDTNRTYETALQRATVKDEEIFLMTQVVPYTSSYGSPVDAKFAQSHAVDWTWSS